MTIVKSEETLLFNAVINDNVHELCLLTLKTKTLIEVQTVLLNATKKIRAEIKGRGTHNGS